MAVLHFHSEVIEQLPDGRPLRLVEIDGPIDASTSAQFREQFVRLLGDPQDVAPALLLSCERLSYVNSTGMGQLLTLRDQALQNGGTIELCLVPSRVVTLFQMLGIESVYDLYQSRAAAVEAIRSRYATRTGSSPALPSAEAVTDSALEAPALDSRSLQEASGRQHAAQAESAALAASAQSEPGRPGAAFGASVATANDAADVPEALPVAAADALVPSSGSTAPSQPAGGTSQPPLYPARVTCVGCALKLRVPAAGPFACPRCRLLYKAGTDGRIQAYRTRRPLVVELSLPRIGSASAIVRAAIEGLAGELQLRETLCSTWSNLTVDLLASILTDPAAAGLGEGTQLPIFLGGDDRSVLSSVKLVAASGSRSPDEWIRTLPSLGVADELELEPLEPHGQTLTLRLTRSPSS